MALEQLQESEILKTKDDNRRAELEKITETLVQEAGLLLADIAAPVVPALIGALEDSDPDVRRAATDALGQIGPQSAPAVPALIAVLEDPDVQWVATDALGQIGPPAVPALIAALEDSDPNVRWAAAQALGQVGPPAVPAAPKIRAALEDEAPEVQAAMAKALVLITGASQEAAVPALIAALEDGDWNVRWAATDALGQIGPPAVPALIAVLEDSDPNVRRAAAMALRQIGQRPGRAAGGD